MSAKHTPGPLRVLKPEPARFPHYTIVDAERRYVAKVDIYAHNRASDDAQLFAAAPDLYAACKASADGVQGWQALMHAALAKAEGRSA